MPAPLKETLRVEQADPYLSCLLVEAVPVFNYPVGSMGCEFLAPYSSCRQEQ